MQNKKKRDPKSTRWHGIVWIVKLTLSHKGREANTSRPLHATQSKSARLAISIRTLYQFVYSVGVVDLQIEINWRNPLQFWGIKSYDAFTDLSVFWSSLERILRCWKWMPWSFLVWRPLQVSFCHKHFIFIIVGIISMFKFMKLFLIKKTWMNKTQCYY